MIRTLIASGLITLALGFEGFNLFMYFRSINDYNRRMDVYTLRENTLRLEYFQVVNDKIGFTSTLYQLRDNAYTLGDSTLMALIDSLKATSASGDFGRYTQAILSYTEDYLSRPMQRLPLWSIITTVLLGVIGVVLMLTDVLSFRKTMGTFVQYIENLRLGILSRRLTAERDFKLLVETLVELSEDLERTRKNARQLAQS